MVIKDPLGEIILLGEIEIDPNQEEDTIQKENTVIFIIDMARSVILKNVKILVLGRMRKTPISSGRCSNFYY